MTDNKTVKFQRRDFQVAGQLFNRWQMNLPANVELETVFEPAAWTHLVDAIWGHNKAGGRGDIIEVRKLDTGLYAEVMVTEISAGFVKVAPIRAYEPKVVEVAESVPFSTRWNVGKLRHEVLRKADNQIMAGDFQSKQSAVEWIDNHMKAMGKKAA